MIMIHPVDTKFKRTGFILKSVVSFIILSFITALLITLSFGFSHENVPISLCLPFIDPANTIPMIKIITLIFILTQTGTVIIVICTLLVN